MKNVNRDIDNLKIELGLPDTANFLGWLIYNEDKDDFLKSYSIGDHIINKIWTLTPEFGKKFPTIKKAKKVLINIEVSDCKVVASFDIGSQILISD